MEQRVLLMVNPMAGRQKIRNVERPSMPFVHWASFFKK